MKIRKYPITPVPKPRQTRADVWKQRPCVMRYRAFADEVRLRGVKLNPYGDSVIFHMPMPKSWSKAKKERMNTTGHQQKPDWDNLAKALCDAIYSDDSHIWNIRVTKQWAYEGSIEIL